MANYKRILLKLSGEALMGEQGGGIDPHTIQRLAGEINDLCRAGVQVGLVIGGGNIIRGAGKGFRRPGPGHRRPDGHAGDGDQRPGHAGCPGASRQPVRVMSALKINQVCEDYIRRRAVRHLEKGRVVIFAAGTGNPFFTTDSAASLRAIEVDAELMIKATKVDGVYSADPVKDPSARFYSRLTYDEALDQRLNVMDATALVLCRDHDMSLRVMNVFQQGAIMRLIKGEDIGSLIVNGK